MIQKKTTLGTHRKYQIRALTLAGVNIVSKPSNIMKNMFIEHSNIKNNTFTHTYLTAKMI